MIIYLKTINVIKRGIIYPRVERNFRYFSPSVIEFFNKYFILIKTWGMNSKGIGERIDYFENEIICNLQADDINFSELESVNTQNLSSYRLLIYSKLLR